MLKRPSTKNGCFAQYPFHHFKGPVAGSKLALGERALPRRIGVELAQIARDRDVRLVAVLLEKKPLQHARARQRGSRQERRAVGEIAQYRVRLGQIGSGLDFQHRHLAVGIHRQELRGARIAARGIDFGPGIRALECLERHAHLVAVARRRRAKDPEHCALLAASMGRGTAGSVLPNSGPRHMLNVNARRQRRPEAITRPYAGFGWRRRG